MKIQKHQIVKGGFGVAKQTFELTGTYSNPDENVQITVTYTAPNASTIVVGGFHFGF